MRGFRNLEHVLLNPGPRLNVVHGDNGQGKSNLLEAIFYLGSLKSFRLAARDDLIGHDKDRASLAGRFSGEPLPTTCKVRLARTKARALALNDKRPRSTAAWVAAIQMVLFHPGHLSLAIGSPENRRAFVDRMLEQIDVTYAKTAAMYVKALRSRNRLLKREAQTRAITAYDDILASTGEVIGRARSALVEEIKPLAEQAFARVTERALPLSLDYRPRTEPTRDAIERALSRSLHKDRARGFTTEGPHGDDIALTIDSRVARHHASQGQHRAMVLALKIAELEVIGRRVGRVPILLLDDVSSELDRARTATLFDVLDELGGQVFLTTTRPELVSAQSDRDDFSIAAGVIEKSS